MLPILAFGPWNGNHGDMNRGDVALKAGKHKYTSCHAAKCSGTKRRFYTPLETDAGT